MGKNKELEKRLIVGAKVKIGERYADFAKGYLPGTILTLVEGYFERDNGLYSVSETAPSHWDEAAKEFDSIYHLFGNDLENFMDCEIINQ